MTNILFGAVGGQGLVLATRVVCEAALLSGYDVKSNDVVGLSQRGGKIWGSVRFGEKVWSPNIPQGEADFLVGLEPLEGLRWSGMLKPEGVVILNTAKIPPVPVMMEKEGYPEGIPDILRERFRVIDLDASAAVKALGNIKMSNILLLGVLARQMDIPKVHWEEAIRGNVPAKALSLNLKAFDLGWEEFGSI